MELEIVGYPPIKPEVTERVLEARVSNAQRRVDDAKAEHREALRDLRKYRRAKVKADIQKTIDSVGMHGAT